MRGVVVQLYYVVLVCRNITVLDFTRPLFYRGSFYILEGRKWLLPIGLIFVPVYTIWLQKPFFKSKNLQEAFCLFFFFFLKHIVSKYCLTNMVLWVIMRTLQIIFAFNFYIIATMNKVLNYLSTMSGAFLFPNIL